MRTLASHQCGLGSIPGPGATCGLSLLLVLVPAPRVFSPGSPVFLPPQKPTLQIPFRCGNEGNGFVSLAVSVTSLNNIDCYFFYLLLGATIMVSKHCPIIGEHVVIIFVTQ